MSFPVVFGLAWGWYNITSLGLRVCWEFGFVVGFCQRGLVARPGCVFPAGLVVWARFGLPVGLGCFRGIRAIVVGVLWCDWCGFSFGEVCMVAV